MTDAEMVRWLRSCSLVEREPLYAIADRLARLTAPPGKRPVDEAREAEIRSVDGHWLGLRNPLAQAVHDLLALFDWSEGHRRLAECALQDLLAEKHEYCVAAGVAKAISQIDTYLNEIASRQFTSDIYRTEALVVVRANVEGRCGPASLPPHEATLAENRRLREALRKIADTGLRTAVGIARAALIEEGRA